MARGHVDWGQGQAIETIHTISDVGEIVYRLGGMISNSRSGNAVFIADFSDGIEAWIQTVSAATSYIKAMVSNILTGGASALLHAHSLAGSYAILGKRITLPDYNRVGLELYFRQISTGYIDIIDLYHVDGSTSAWARVRLDWVNLKVQIIDATLGTVNVGSITSSFRTLNTYHNLKLVVDFDTNTYRYLILDERRFDLTDYSLSVAGSSDCANLQMNISAYGDAAKVDELMVDNIIVTINEP